MTSLIGLTEEGGRYRHPSTRRALEAPAPGLPRSWRVLAACAGCDPTLFHNRARQRSALACCAACQVAEPCLFTALVHEEATGYRFGVWGATIPAERVRIADYLAGRHLSVVELFAGEESWWARRLGGLLSGSSVAA
jgi:hypothetical protein